MHYRISLTKIAINAKTPNKSSCFIVLFMTKENILFIILLFCNV